MCLLHLWHWQADSLPLHHLGSPINSNSFTWIITSCWILYKYKLGESIDSKLFWSKQSQWIKHRKRGVSPREFALGLCQSLGQLATCVNLVLWASSIRTYWQASPRQQQQVLLDPWAMGRTTWRGDGGSWLVELSSWGECKTLLTHQGKSRSFKHLIYPADKGTPCQWTAVAYFFAFLQDCPISQSYQQPHPMALNPITNNN